MKIPKEKLKKQRNTVRIILKERRAGNERAGIQAIIDARQSSDLTQKELSERTEIA